MFATLESRRRTSCSLLISRLNTPTLFFSRTAACSAMLSAKLVFPTLGRAARMIRSLFWSPVVSASRSVKPVRTPLISPRWAWR
jgi:hypothetical protein